MKWTLLRTGLLVVLLASLVLPTNLGTVVRVDAAPSIVSAPGPDDPIPARYIYGVTPDGQLLVYVDASSDTAANWLQQAIPAPTLPG